MKLNFLTAILLSILFCVVVSAQEPVPKSAPEKVLPDAEAKALIESLRTNEIQSLSFLPRVFVVSDRITLDLITQGFKINEMIKSIEISLNNAGLKTVDIAEFKTMAKEGHPFLKIKVEVSQDDKNNNSYSGLVKVALTQRVIMGRLANTQVVAGQRPFLNSSYFADPAVVFGETWHTQRCVTKMTREDVARTVVDIIVKEFIKDYQKARQK